VINGAAFHRSVHLNEAQLHAAEPCCQICRADARDSVLPLQSEPDVELLRCRNCHAVSASRMPTDDALAEYYRDYYRSDLKEDVQSRVTFDNSERFGRHLASRAWPLLQKENLAILDYGGGDGTISIGIAEVFLEQGASAVSIVVVDYNESLASPSDDRISIAAEQTLETVDGRFDFIVASAILEHIPNLAEALWQLFSLMSPGAVFYARTPNIVSLIKLGKFLGVDVDFTYPAHLYDLGQDFWENYIQRQSKEHAIFLVSSRPAIVETTFRKHFLRTLTAYLFKAPWALLGRSYTLVGGWEVFCQKRR